MTVYLNGEFTPMEQAKISVLDRGFVFGDGVYEVVPVYSRRAFRLAEHLARLGASLAAVRIDNPHSEARWIELIERVIAGGPWEDQSVYLQVTRGVAPRNPCSQRDHPDGIHNERRPGHALKALIETGAAAVMLEDFRGCAATSSPCPCSGTACCEPWPMTKAPRRRYSRGIFTEAAASNVFIVRSGKVLTPPKSQLILAGITYDVVLRFCRKTESPRR